MWSHILQGNITYSLADKEIDFFFFFSNKILSELFIWPLAIGTRPSPIDRLIWIDINSGRIPRHVHIFSTTVLRNGHQIKQHNNNAWQWAHNGRQQKVNLVTTIFPSITAHRIVHCSRRVSMGWNWIFAWMMQSIFCTKKKKERERIQPIAKWIQAITITNWVSGKSKKRKIGPQGRNLALRKSHKEGEGGDWCQPKKRRRTYSTSSEFKKREKKRRRETDRLSPSSFLPCPPSWSLTFIWNLSNGVIRPPVHPSKGPIEFYFHFALVDGCGHWGTLALHHFTPITTERPTEDCPRGEEE